MMTDPALYHALIRVRFTEEVGPKHLEALLHMLEGTGYAVTRTTVHHQAVAFIINLDVAIEPVAETLLAELRDKLWAMDGVEYLSTTHPKNGNHFMDHDVHRIDDTE